MITTALASAGTGPRRFYLGDTGQYVVNDWYYLGSDGAMVKGQQTIDGKWYIMDDAGRMLTDPVTLTPDQDGALQWPGLAG